MKKDTIILILITTLLTLCIVNITLMLLNLPIDIRVFQYGLIICTILTIWLGILVFKN